MSLVEFNDEDEVVEQPTTVISEPEAYKGVVVDTRYTPKDNLLIHIEGSSWIVNYYSQVLNTDNAPTGQNVNSNPIYQQYKLIEKFELKVTSPLTTSQDSTTKEMTLVGTATIYPFIIPNEGDMFLADVGDGREAIFKITNSDRKSIFKNTTYSIEYVLIDYSTVERRSDLNNKVISKYIFRNDFLSYGQNPLVTKKENDLVVELENHFEEIINVYFKSFFSNEFKTLLIPGQGYPVYDHFLTKALLKYFNTWDCKDIKFVNLLNVDDDNNLKTNTIWDMLVRLDKRLMNYVANEYGLVNTKLFTRNPMMSSIYHSRIRYIIYPKNPVLDVDYEMRNKSKLLSPEKLKHVPPRTNLPDFTDDYQDDCDFCDFDHDLKKEYDDKKNGLEGSPVGEDLQDDVIDHEWDFSDILDPAQHMGIVIPDIHLVTLDDFYVFTSSFYRQNNGLQSPGMSKLEVVVCQMLNGKKLDNELLIYFCETYHSWGALERYYYIPILLILIKYAIRS